jgi:hypothetical protein
MALYEAYIAYQGVFHSVGNKKRASPNSQPSLEDRRCFAPNSLGFDLLIPCWCSPFLLGATVIGAYSS